MRKCEIVSCDKPVFGTDRNTKHGYCKFHQYKRTDIIRKISRLPKKVKEKSEAPENYQQLQLWFDNIAKEIKEKPYCWNCGKYITKAFYRAATAHILPKRKEYGFPSVATHPKNYLILGPGCGCHAKYDTSWDDACMMKIWPMAVERFIAIFPEIDRKEYKNLPDVLLQEVEINRL